MNATETAPPSTRTSRRPGLTTVAGARLVDSPPDDATPAEPLAPARSRKKVGYKEASDYLGIPEGSLRSLVSRKEIDFFRVTPRIVTFDLDELDKFLESKRNAPAPARKSKVAR